MQFFEFVDEVFECLSSVFVKCKVVFTPFGTKSTYFLASFYCSRVVEEGQSRLESELDALKADVLSQDVTRFTTLMSGKRSISDRYAAFRARFRGRTPGSPPIEGMP